jgi:WD40 repeat protein
LTDFDQANAILTRFCSGCHHDGNAEGDFSVSSYESLLAVTSQGKPRIVPGKPDQSLIFQVLTGHAEPAMPPSDEPQLNASQIAVIEKWIAQGANLSSDPSPKMSHGSQLPKLSSAQAKDHLITAGTAINDQLLALGRMGQVQLVNPTDGQMIHSIDGLPGKVTALRLSADGQTLIVGTGHVGQSGQVILVRVSDWKVQSTYSGHTDAVYGASISNDGRWLAAGSYDRTVIVWDLSTGQQSLQLTGHNGAVYDLDFHPSSQALATASADQTIKLWHIPSGRLLDTLGQP